MIGQADRAFDFLRILELVGLENGLRKRLLEPRAVGVADFGIQPGAEQNLHLEVMVLDQAQHSFRIGTGIIKSNETEIALPIQKLKVFEGLLVAGIDRPRSAVGVLSVAETGITNAAPNSAQQIARFLLDRHGGGGGVGCVRSVAGWGGCEPG